MARSFLLFPSLAMTHSCSLFPSTLLIRLRLLFPSDAMARSSGLFLSATLARSCRVSFFNNDSLIGTVSINDGGSLSVSPYLNPFCREVYLDLIAPSQGEGYFCHIPAYSFALSRYCPYRACHLNLVLIPEANPDGKTKPHR